MEATAEAERDREDRQSQIKKRVQNPTMKWVFYMFQGVAEVHVKIKNNTLTDITNMTEDLKTILGQLGEHYEKYYS